MSWLARLGFAAAPKPRVAAIGPEAGERLAAIHAGAFARPWSAGDFDGFRLEPTTRMDGLYLGRDPLPCGFALSRIAADEAEILSVALARGVRGHGHSRLLLAYHLQGLAHARVAHVHLEVEEGNGPAIALYRRLGFVQTGTRPGYYARLDGTRASAMSMSLSLAGSAAG